MLPTLEEIVAELQTAPVSEAIAQLDGIYVSTRRAIVNVIEAEDEGVIDSDTAEEALEDILSKQVDLQTEVLQMEIPELIEELEQTEEEGTPIETFGDGFAMMLAEEYDSIQSGLNTISGHTGIDQQTLIAYLNDQMVPDPNTAAAITSCFEMCQENPELIDQMAMIAGDQMAETAEYAANQNQIAQFAYERQAFAQERAEFARQGQIQQRLKAIERMADDLYNNNYITPDQRRRIMPQGLEADDRAEFSAFFAQTATKIGTTPEQYLDCIEFTLNFLQDGGQQQPMLLADFGQYQEPDPIDSQEAAQLTGYRKLYGYN